MVEEEPGEEEASPGESLVDTDLAGGVLTAEELEDAATDEGEEGFEASVEEGCAEVGRRVEGVAAEGVGQEIEELAAGRDPGTGEGAEDEEGSEVDDADEAVGGLGDDAEAGALDDTGEEDEGGQGQEVDADGDLLGDVYQEAQTETADDNLVEPRRQAKGDVSGPRRTGAGGGRGGRNGAGSHRS
jgi:hypothetical protein